MSGSVMLSPTSRAFDAPESDPSIVMPGPDFEVWWVETDMAGAMLLGTMPSDYDTATMLASFSGSFMVPATSAPGQHQVAVLIVQGTTPACEDFTVTTTVQEDAYVLTATSLPASLPGTGLMLMAPVTGLLAVGAGGYVIRTRSRRR
ncbi:MAG: hypothetical protein HZB44_07255 [Actinobacteria bacterium]|nr:hypothetical protein [Actinomycetota bacterium]